MIIDTHIHLYDDKYTNAEDIIIDAQKNDVSKMIVVGYDKKSSFKAIQLAEKYSFLYAAIGIHPSEVLKENDLLWLDELVLHNKVVAIGEIGLDYYWDKSFIAKQKEMFEYQINIARKYNKPLIIHSRDAIQDTYDILKKYSLTGVIHCFSSSVQMAKQFIKLGYFLGIGGVVTFKNSKEIKEVVKEIPINYLLSETDGPYLSPEPFRGKVNKPSYLPLVIDKIAFIKGMDVNDVKNILKDNAKKLFNLR